MAGLTKENLEGLVQLQEQDRSLDKIRSELAVIPAQVLERRDALAAEKQKLAVAHEKALRLAVQRKEMELEVADKEAAIKKHQNELNAVKSNDAFKALLHEIDSAKELKTRLEDEILGLMEQAEEIAREEAQERVQAAKLEGETAQRLRELDGRRAELEAEASSLQARRDETAARVSPEILAQYDSIRRRRQGVAVVPVRKDYCGGCNMQLTPQARVEVRKPGTLVICDSCQRILYLQG